LLQLLDLDFLSAVERRYRLSGDLALELQNRDVNQSGRENGSAMAVSLQGSTELERRIMNLDYERYITPSFKFEAGVKDRYLTQKRPRSVLIVIQNMLLTLLIATHPGRVPEFGIHNIYGRHGIVRWDQAGGRRNRR
jgi:hypothetical protein